jgi:hypothetical protein
MKGINPGQLKNILGTGAKVLGTIGDSIKQPEEPQTKGIFGKNDEIEALNAELAVKQAQEEKSKKTMMYVVIGAVVLLLFGKKLMK